MTLPATSERNLTPSSTELVSEVANVVGAADAEKILVAPGVFYGNAGSRHVRVAFTATDERVGAAAARLAALA